VKVDTLSPFAYGMPEDALATYVAGGQVYETVPGARSADVHRVVNYIDRDILQSGWLLGEEAIANRAAMVSVRHGKGTIVMIGFRAQHRAQTRDLQAALQRAGGAGGIGVHEGAPKFRPSRQGDGQPDPGTSTPGWQRCPGRSHRPETGLSHPRIPVPRRDRYLVRRQDGRGRRSTPGPSTARDRGEKGAADGGDGMTEAMIRPMNLTAAGAVR